MTQTFHLGSWRGVRIGAHSSMLIVGWLLTWSLTATVLPEATPGYSEAAYWVAGALTACAFLASIGLHEMAHAVVAVQHLRTRTGGWNDGS